MVRTHSFGLAAITLYLTFQSMAVGQTVRKVAEDFEQAAWPVDGWNKAVGTTALADDVGEGQRGKSLLIEVRFSGHGFEWFGVSPPEPLVVPGDAKSVALRYKLADKRYPLIVKFKDGWGRAEVGSKKLEWSPPCDKEGPWATATFTVPADWVRPVTIAGFATHNWSAQNEARTVRFGVDQLAVETDLSGVDPVTGVLKSWKPDPQPKEPKTALKEPPRTPLLSVEFSTGQPSNVFAGQRPAAIVRVRSWLPATLTGSLSLEVRDHAGQSAHRQQTPLTVESTAAVRSELPITRFGLYTLSANLLLADGTRRDGKLVFANLPAGETLSEADKAASPYGVNVNGGRNDAAVEPFRRAGIVWFRDYAFSYEWLLRAKGDDRRYAGWPWYPTIMKRYEAAGAKVLPCLMKALQPPAGKAGSAVGRVGPDREWVRAVADIVNSFPSLTHWELDNEYDLNKAHADAENAIQWQNYRTYHRRFADIVDLLGNGQVTAVEQGQAGIWPERIEQCVKSGDFAKIGVVNSHYYCGAEPPELNIANWNTGFEGDWRGQAPAFLFDQLQAAKRAAASDGRARESWLTEFGWDSLAGPKVSPYQQAVYLARGWMLALAAGTDKCFWFYDFDAAEPKQFFDGCGLLTAEGNPKLALCALAGLTTALPRPKYVGSINAGPGTCGYVFANGADLVAALWSVEKEPGPTVEFRARELRDYLGNRLPGNRVALALAPVYAIGLDRNDVWCRQTAVELSSPRLIEAAAGDAAEVRFEIGSDNPLLLGSEATRAGTIRAELPAGWKADHAEVSYRVEPKGRATVAFPFVIGPQESRATADAAFLVHGLGSEKHFAVKVLVRPPLSMQVGRLPSRPGATKLTVQITNRSTKPLDGRLRLTLPATWRAGAAEIPVANIKPHETCAIACPLTWDTNWKSGERAMAEFDAGGGRRIARPILPGRTQIPRVGKLTIDGKADDWPAAAQLPVWLLGSTRGEPAAAVSLAWGQDGLYGFVEVPQADLENPDPRSFWAANCLELFLDSRDDKKERSYSRGDHQFWFVPLVDERRVYVGQWKRGTEIPETRYDIRGIEGVAVRAGRGYRMEFRLPAAEIQGWSAVKTLGLNVNLTVRSGHDSREVFWPAPKNDGITEQPAKWGSAELGAPSSAR